MASRTTHSDWSNQDPDFQVLARNLSAGVGDSTLYVIALPMALLRRGGWSLTKFGRALLPPLLTLDGVSPGIEPKAPHVVVLFVEHDRVGESPLGIRHRSAGLHADICETIQQAIDQNRGRVQRAAEWLRRII